MMKLNIIYRAAYFCAVFLFWHTSLSLHVSAAPHILGRPEHKLDSVGRTPLARMTGMDRVLSLSRAPESYPAIVNLLFLRIDFQDETTVDDWSPCSYGTPPALNEDDPNTTGLGTWNDPVYEGDLWVDQAALFLPKPD